MSLVSQEGAHAKHIVEYQGVIIAAERRESLYIKVTWRRRRAEGREENHIDLFTHRLILQAIG
jgi:hypothetical protein